MYSFSVWSTAKDRAEKKRHKGTQPKGSGETMRSQPSVGVTQTPPPTTKSSQRATANTEREPPGKEKPTRDSLRRGESCFKHVPLSVSHCSL